MNLETINKWLDEEYGRSYTKLEELHNFYFEKYCDLKQENQRQKEVISKLNFIKNRKKQGASQVNINKMAIEFVNSYLKEVSE